jgi:lipoprotein signal peptidase
MKKRATLLCTILAVVGGVFVCDQWTKSFFLERAASSWPIPHVIETTHHFNHGLIANVPAPNNLIIFIMISTVIVLILALKRNFDQGHILDSIAFASLAGGAFGNLFDRIANGYVFDWLLLLNWSIVNVADIAIACGIAILFISHRHAPRPSA